MSKCYKGRLIFKLANKKLCLHTTKLISYDGMSKRTASLITPKEMMRHTESHYCACCERHLAFFYYCKNYIF